jgi:hypothetical protein
VSEREERQRHNRAKPAASGQGSQLFNGKSAKDELLADSRSEHKANAHGERDRCNLMKVEFRSRHQPAYDAGQHESGHQSGKSRKKVEPAEPAQAEESRTHSLQPEGNRGQDHDNRPFGNDRADVVTNSGQARAILPGQEPLGKRPTESNEHSNHGGNAREAREELFRVLVIASHGFSPTQ